MIQKYLFYIAITVCQEQPESPLTRISWDPLILIRLQLLWCTEMVSKDRMSHSPEVMVHVLQKNTSAREVLSSTRKDMDKEESGDPALFSALLLTAVSCACSLHSWLVSTMDAVTAQTTCQGSCMTCSGASWQAGVNPSSSKPSKLGKEEVSPLCRGGTNEH